MSSLSVESPRMNYLAPNTYSTMAVALVTGLTLSANTTRAAEPDWKVGLI